MLRNGTPVITISDSSPLIALHAIDRLNLLRTLYQSILVPPAVAAEVKRFPMPVWIHVTPVPGSVPELAGERGPGPGESEAIRLALHLKPDQILLDEENGRAAADRRGLFVIGVLGVLITAKKAGILGSIRCDLDRLRETSFHVSSRLYREILVRAGEP